MFIIQKLRLIFTFVRFKPFFPFQTLKGFEEEEEEHIHIQQWALTEGRLKVTLLECSRYVLCFVITTLWERKYSENVSEQYLCLFPLCVNLHYIICKFFKHKFYKTSPFQLVKDINCILESILMGEGDHLLCSNFQTF